MPAATPPVEPGTNPEPTEERPRLARRLAGLAAQPSLTNHQAPPANHQTAPANHQTAPTTGRQTGTVAAARPHSACLDGNEAAASVAHRLSEVCTLYPITPSSPMGEHADEWSAAGRTNLWGQVPRIVQLQSEAGAIGALHGAVQAGALAASFTSSQGLLLMLPNMFKIAGELTPAVLHVAARAVATHALSIFGDHSDVMAARSAGWGMLSSTSVQEAHDLAAIAHAASLDSRIPFLHFFDGFRTSHEVNRIELLSDHQLRALIDEQAVLDHRARALTPAHPVLRGTAQNPDVFFQAREAANPFYDAAPGLVTAAMDRFARLTGRHYRTVEYYGSPDATRVIVVMGSAARTAKSVAEALNAAGDLVGVVLVRLFRPFPTEALAAALPAGCRAIAVLDRVKDPGAPAQPLHLDVVTALAEHRDRPPRAIGGVYGLGSKEFAPRDAAAVFAELGSLVRTGSAKTRFTVGVTDDVTRRSLPTDPAFRLPSSAIQAVFYGLGSDGTVGANKAAVKLIGEHTDLSVQGYFIYDSKKSGSTTISHLRFGPDPIDAPYLIEQADFVAVHQFRLLSRIPVLDVARPGATVLLACPHRAADAWHRLPAAVRRTITEKGLRVYLVDAAGVARRAGLGGRINTVMQACFFACANLVPREQALALIKDSARAVYARRGPDVVRSNLDAIDHAIAAMVPLVVPDAAQPEATGLPNPSPPNPSPHNPSPHNPSPPDPSPPELGLPELESVDRSTPDAPEHSSAPATAGRVLTTVRHLVAGQGDRLPVSAMPVDGTFPTGTASLEKRGLADDLPIWTPGACIDCGKCTLICPHSAIRMRAYPSELLASAPAGFLSKPTVGRDLPAGSRLTVQLAPDDCTGCTLCVQVCPADCLEMVPAETVREVERPRYDFFRKLPDIDRTTLRTNTVKGSQLLLPLFEFSGACSGCGETPYVKLLSQLMGDRMIVANATGCSSIYGGNLPTTPWTRDAEGCGPAWSNSLFEDNAEFGLGIHFGRGERAAQARSLLADLAPALGLPAEVLNGLLRTDIPVTDEAEVAAQRDRVRRLQAALADLGTPAATGRAAAPTPPADCANPSCPANPTASGNLTAHIVPPGYAVRTLTELADALIPTAVWVVGGDGWAYDIGFGGLDHLFASGENINVLVLDSEVYSNTGGQASKATPMGAAATFAVSGKPTRKKDLGLIAQTYRDVYVAQIALAANEMQTVRALQEAAAYPGPSLVIAYSPCREHGIDLSDGIAHQRAAVTSGHWPLYRYHPEPRPGAAPQFKLDSRPPTMPIAEFYATESRFQAVARSDPARAAELFARAQQQVDQRWAHYARLAAGR